MPLATAKSKLARQENATAFFRVSPSALTLTAEDKASGIIRGVKIMELGKLASFEGPNGKARTSKITERHISALLGFAGNRALPIHWTHAWHKAEEDNLPNADQVELEARCGAWKQHRKDSEGNVIADAYLRDDKYRADILFSAEHNPEDLMASAVFNYDRNDPESMPLNYRCADFVPCGAATTALFSETQTNTAKMALTLDEIKEALGTPEGEAYIGGIMKIHGKLKADADKAAADAAAAADGSSDSAATAAALKKFKDDLTAEFETKKTALLAEVDTKAQAAATALLGKGGYVQSGGDAKKDEVEARLGAYVAAGAANRGVAIMRFAHDKPEEYNAARAAGKL